MSVKGVKQKEKWRRSVPIMGRGGVGDIRLLCNLEPMSKAGIWKTLKSWYQQLKQISQEIDRLGTEVMEKFVFLEHAGWNNSFWSSSLSRYYQSHTSLFSSHHVDCLLHLAVAADGQLHQVVHKGL